MNNPFEEEFEPSDVVNKSEIDSGISEKPISDKRDTGFLKGKLSKDDIDSIINYDESRRKAKAFKNQINPDVNLADDRYNTNDKFKDFLEAPKISGRGNLKGESLLYPANQVKKTGNKVEIVDASYHQHHNKGKASVLINRDEKGNLDNIEIICSCGEQILLKFDSVDRISEDELTKIIDSEMKEPTPFHQEDSDSFKIGEDVVEEGALFSIEKSDFNLNESLQEETNEENPNQSDQSDEVFWDDDFYSDDELDTGVVDLSGI